MIPAGLRVAIVPFPALGDLTIYLRLAQAFSAAGACVTYYSDHLSAAASRFDWLQVTALGQTGVRALLAEFDLVIWDAGAPLGRDRREDGFVLAEMVDAHAHLAVVTAKKLPQPLSDCRLPLTIGGREFGPKCATFCQDGKAGLTMVDWVDRYAAETFGLAVPSTPPGVTGEGSSRAVGRKAVIFPTTPNPRKNYWPQGFRRIANSLAAAGWDVSFVVMPAEHSRLEGEYPRFPVVTFPDLDQLIAYLQDTCIVISNDSGGGHLASMMGLHTVTITRKPPNFVWRPGFNGHNTVLSPLLTFKGWGGHVWRPFVPYWRAQTCAEEALRRLVGCRRA
ncbi:ADP-heptose--LPS heptosyltransferase [Pseudothauera nasutitermitis]|uniref:ADP-heptose--LPS heptosyltransferase n=1 Tax=Pseudothauera nasutitermitis TaxID=2565930 RepID=A0A4S4ATA2_9RHOO|nr:glycosyltransferase family 9 protein [Pseudothauera nasutitermitis]THF63135.1 ADP-heptose--LPS heptosyltransferase [Pseudothauera nasutitermitis]